MALIINMKTYRFLEEGETVQWFDEFTPKNDFKFMHVAEYIAGVWYAVGYEMKGQKVRPSWVGFVRRPVTSFVLGANNFDAEKYNKTMWARS